jgi:hypothetical protein
MKEYVTTIRLYVIGLICLGFVFIAGCTVDEERAPRLSMFIGIDVSGSFVDSDYYDNSISFLAHYIYGHLHKVGELEEPNALFVSSIGGDNPDEPKTFYPIQTFEDRSVEEIEEQLRELFPTEELDPITDFNAFFEHVARTVRNRNLVLRPISVVLLSDGIPDIEREGETDFRSIDFSPLERLSRNITIRLLYTDPGTGRAWETQIPRRRVKIWTQDADVMTSWNDSTIYLPNRPVEEQERWIDWTLDNVDYGVRARRVD